MDIDISKVRSLWVILPKPLNQSGTIIDSIGIHVDQVMQQKGDPLWAIRSGSDLCLGKDGEWMVEPLASARDEEYIRNYRFSSINEAINFVLQGIGSLTGDVIQYRGKNLTVFSDDEKEIIVYGSGSDWIVQQTKVTNHVSPWRRWFASRQLAENEAEKMLNQKVVAKISFDEFSISCQYYSQRIKADDQDYCYRERGECSEENCPLFHLKKIRGER